MYIKGEDRDRDRDTVGYCYRETWDPVNSTWYAPGVAIAPPTPTRVTVTTAWSDGVVLAWDTPSLAPDRYLIEWTADGSEWFIIDEVDGGETSYIGVEIGSKLCRIPLLRSGSGAPLGPTRPSA